MTEFLKVEHPPSGRVRLCCPRQHRLGRVQFPAAIPSRDPCAVVDSAKSIGHAKSSSRVFQTAKLSSKKERSSTDD